MSAFLGFFKRSLFDQMHLVGMMSNGSGEYPSVRLSMLNAADELQLHMFIPETVAHRIRFYVFERKLQIGQQKKQEIELCQIRQLYSRDAFESFERVGKPRLMLVSGPEFREYLPYFFISLLAGNKRCAGKSNEAPGPFFLLVFCSCLLPAVLPPGKPDCKKNGSDTANSLNPSRPNCGIQFVRHLTISIRAVFSWLKNNPKGGVVSCT